MLWNSKNSKEMETKPLRWSGTGEWKRNAEGERQEDRMDSSEYVITGMEDKCPYRHLPLRMERKGPWGGMEASDGRETRKGTRGMTGQVGPNT